MGIHTANVHDVLKGEAVTGRAVLVDRLWPRGVAKADLHPDLWLREVAPSTELRRWFGHDPEKFTEFTRRYRAELDNSGAAELQTLLDATRQPITLLYGAADRSHNQAVVLAEWLRDQGLA